jgi:hypothetical protein
LGHCGKRHCERGRVRQLLGKRKRCVGKASAGVIVAFELGHPRELAEDVHLLRGLQAWLGEGVAQVAHGHGKTLLHPARACELGKGLSSDSTGRR